MTLEAVLVKMLDIYFSNFLIAMGWMTASAVFVLGMKKHILELKRQ